MTGVNRPAERFLEDRKPPRTLTIGAAAQSFDGSAYYRIWLPFKHLTDNSLHRTGVRAPYGPTLTPADVEDFQVLVVQKAAGREGLLMLEQLAGQVRLVYEVDDDMLRADPSGVPHLGQEEREHEQLRETIRRCLRLCDMATTTNEHLAEQIRPYNDNIVVLPNFVKAGLLDIPRARKPDPAKVTVGWAGGSSHLVDMVTVQDVLADMLADEPDVDMHMMGFDFSPLLRDQRHRCRRAAWRPDVGDYYKRVDFDIAVAPSADIPFNRSKTPIRALEMAALGIPIVAANRLPYSDFVVDGKTGFLVDDYPGWRRALHDLIHDPGLRQEMGDNAREQAAGWTIEGNWQLWEQAYEKAAGG